MAQPNVIFEGWLRDPSIYRFRPYPWQQTIVAQLLRVQNRRNADMSLNSYREPDMMIVGRDAHRMITGWSSDFMVMDDTGLHRVKAKPVKKDYNTVGVRFLFGPNLGKIYTYRIRKGAKVHLGQELVAPAGEQNELKVVVVVRIDKVPQDTMPYITYKAIESKVAAL